MKKITEEQKDNLIEVVESLINEGRMPSVCVWVGEMKGRIAESLLKGKEKGDEVDCLHCLNDMTSLMRCAM